MDPLDALWASGLTMVIAFRPAAAPTVETFTVAVVALVRVTLLTVTPGMIADSRHRYPTPGSKKAVPPLEVAVTVRLIDATPLGMTEGLTLTSVGAPGPTVRPTANP